uniref:Large ribosomal subunit protein mL42 n=1 Tax=Electrophorus electricus TaxID=8005 RepID=A0AAY5F195_ELEEL
MLARLAGVCLIACCRLNFISCIGCAKVFTNIVKAQCYGRDFHFISPTGALPVNSAATHQVSRCVKPSNVDLGLTRDGKTVVCFHPEPNISYEMTQPIPKVDPITASAETHDVVLKSRLSGAVLKEERGPTIEELSKMFYTTKHRWYPVGE